MSTVPREVQEKIEFFELRTAAGKPWAVSATQIGLTAGEVTALNAKVVAARAAYDAAQALRAQAKAATFTVREAVAEMSRAGAEAILKIRAKGSSDPAAYALAEIPAPATPSPVAAPGKPTSLTVGLLEGGALDLAWKCPNPAGSTGTIYQVWRRDGLAGSFAFIGATGTKALTDGTVPAGTATITYKIVAVRSTAFGPEAQFIVSLGVGGAGEQTASVSAAAGGGAGGADGAPKLAA